MTAVVVLGVAVTDNLVTAMIDRSRALSMARSAILAGRSAPNPIRDLLVLPLISRLA